MVLHKIHISVQLFNWRRGVAPRINPTFDNNNNVFIDEDTIENTLNRIYNPVGLNWSAVDFYSITVNYDMNNNRMFKSGAPGGTFSNVMLAIIGRCQICQNTLINTYNRILFLVDNIEGNTSQVTSYSRMLFNQQFWFIYPETPRDNLRKLLHMNLDIVLDLDIYMTINLVTHMMLQGTQIQM